MRYHPNKHVNAAIQYAILKGWTMRKGGGHAMYIVMCPANHRGGCRRSVWSTPRDPEAHARDLISDVDRCRH